MIGTLINAIAIIIGTAVGLLARKGISERLRDTVVQGQGLCVMLIGLSGALKTQNTLCVILCIVIGGLLGSAVDIELRLNQLGGMLERRFASDKQEGSIAKGFVTASLVFCVGAMAIVGAMDSGLRGDHSTLIAKAILDGVFSVFFAGSLGVGVGLSAVAVFVYQGLIALLAGWLEPLLTEAVITEMSAVGGLLITGIGLNMIYDEKHIPVGNMLPAIFLPMAYLPISGLF
ncbi:MAG: DUF554 domain-containing protein [Christensenellaceae bacterium]|nr:DUF554 domain-containing protein [Christensenellaceae bacterium]